MFYVRLGNALDALSVIGVFCVIIGLVWALVTAPASPLWLLAIGILAIATIYLVPHSVLDRIDDADKFH